jgi:hypothetical protein
MKSNRDGIGARIEIQTETGKITRLRKGGCGLMSTHDPRLTIGLGPIDLIKEVKVYWPSGIVSQIRQVKTDQELTIIESK